LLEAPATEGIKVGVPNQLSKRALLWKERVLKKKKSNRVFRGVEILEVHEICLWQKKM